jgi:hypothetical protein
MFTGTLPPAFTRADWSEVFELYDDETGELIDLTDVTITFQIRDECRHIDASILFVSLGKFEVSFSRYQLSCLCAGNYDVGCTIARNGVVSQEFLGSIPVFDGVVR